MFEDVIKYIGCIGVKTSMRSLDHRTRSEVAKESINRLCKANNIIRKNDKIKPNQDYIGQMLDDQPNLSHSGTDVRLCVTTTHLKIISKETEQVIVQHEMPNVSFASSGDDETVDFVAYVAKDKTKFGRACFVLECGYKSGKNVLDTIARGFQLRTQQILYNSNTLSKNPTGPYHHDRFGSGLTNLFQSTDSHDTSLDASYRINNENDRNDSLIAATRASLDKETWFHGSYLSREESETRLKHDGDFLVRESMLDPGHFVLSVMHDGEKLHLLFDSMGQVKTKEVVFEDISHLIRYHHDEGEPIVAENRVVYLRNGVRPTPRTKPITQ